MALAIALLCGIARVLAPKHQAVREDKPKPSAVDHTVKSSRPRSNVRSTEPRVARSPIRQQLLPKESSTSPAARLPTEPVKSEARAEKSEPKATATKPTTPPVREAIQDPMARVALAYVGADPDAEAYWYEAINNASLSAHERQDLIEDLNEDGLSDPHNPTMEDLPLILNRIELIEAVVWDAMDEVNADAFQEAYKDLVNLAIQAMSNG